jgi:hypothetical protein
MSEDLVGLYSLKPIIDVLFGFGAIVMFAEFVIVLRHALTMRFTAGRIVELCLCAFLFVICLDWVSAFLFFKNTFAPIIWNILNGGTASQATGELRYALDILGSRM